MPDLLRRPADEARLPALGLLVAAVVLLIGLLTAWFLRARDAVGPGTAAGVVREDEAPASGRDLAAPDAGARTDASAGDAFALDGGIEIPAGVRLPGVGRLAGRALDRASGAPLAGVRVDLLPLPPAGAQVFGRLLHLANPGDDLELRALPIAITGTDATGAFRFEGVRAGQYFLAARGTRHVQDGVATARVLAAESGGPVDVWLREGGRVLGRALNPDGTPAGGARIAITAGPTFAIEAARTGDILFLEARTDAEGAFVFCGIPPGDDWQVTATGGAFALSHLADIAVRAGEDTHVVVRTSPGSRIEGRVLSGPGAGEPEDSATTPVAGAHVGVVPRGLRDLSYVSEVLEATHAVTDAAGRYTMNHVPPGEVDVLAIAPAHVPAQGPRLITPAGGTFVAADFVLPRGPTVHGRVTNGAGAPLAGVVVRWNMVDLANFNFDFSFAPLLAQAVEGFDFPKTDADGRFVAGAFAGEPPFRLECSRLGYQGARVDWDPDTQPELEVVLRAGGAVEGIVMDSATQKPVTSFRIGGSSRIDTEEGAPGRRNPFAGAQEVEDPGGRFRVESVAPGEASLAFSAPGYLPRTVDGLAVLEGGTLRGVIVELSPGGVVRGVVQDKAGAPVAGAQVFANAGRDFRGDVRRDGRNGRNGRRGPFTGPGAGPGATPGGFPAAGQGMTGTERFGRPEDVPAGLGGMLAQLGMFGDRAVLSKSDGTFELGGLEEGLVTLYASHRDYVLARAEPVKLASDAPAPVVLLTLSRGSGIFGTATDRFGRPVQGAIVLALSPANVAGQGNRAGGGVHQGNTDAEGRYSIDHVSAGGYFVLLTRGDQALNPMSFLGTLNFDLVTVPPDERVQFDVVDTSSGACRVGGFVTAAGEPLSAGSIAALGFESESLLGVDFKLAEISAGGAYEFAGLAPGQYTFQVTTFEKGRAPDRVTLWVEIPDVPEARIDLALPQGGIEGVVRSREGGLPVEGCELVLSRDDAPRPGGMFGQWMARDNGAARARTDARGNFRFERLQAGSYEIALRPPRRAGDEPGFAQPVPREAEVLEGVVRDDLLIELAPALALRGVARNTRGEPLEGVEVVATPSVRGMLPERARSDQAGRFALENLPPGEYDLAADKDGFATAREQDHLLAEGVQPECVLVLVEGVEASVRVLDASGEPVAGASGRLVSESGDASAFANAGRMLSSLFAGKGVSNTQGVLALGNFAPGRYTLEVSRGSRSAQRAVELSEGPPVTLTVRLE